MGNEVSSIIVHSLLTAEDLKQLRTQFPGGGSGTPPTSLSWGVWREIVPEDLLKGVEKVLTTGGGKQSPGNWLTIVRTKNIILITCNIKFLIKFAQQQVKLIEWLITGCDNSFSFETIIQKIESLFDR